MNQARPHRRGDARQRRQALARVCPCRPSAHEHACAPCDAPAKCAPALLRLEQSAQPTNVVVGDAQLKRCGVACWGGAWCGVTLEDHLVGRGGRLLGLLRRGCCAVHERAGECSIVGAHVSDSSTERSRAGHGFAARALTSIAEARPIPCSSVRGPHAQSARARDTHPPAVPRFAAAIATAVRGALAARRAAARALPAARAAARAASVAAASLAAVSPGPALALCLTHTPRARSVETEQIDVNPRACGLGHTVRG